MILFFDIGVRTLKILYALLASSSMLVISNMAYAQNSNANAKTIDGKTTYSVEYFANFHPDNAAQIAEHVPGFFIDDGNNIRGIAGTEGNVLIDGERQSTKGQSIYQYLSGISVKSVDHVEIWQGAALGTLGGKYSTLLNIVRKKDAKSSGSVELTIAKWGHKETSPSYSAKYEGKYKNFNYTLSAAHQINQREQRVGHEFLWDKNNSLIESGVNWERQYSRQDEISFSTDGKIGKSKINSNIQYSNQKYDRPWSNIITLSGGDNINRVESGNDADIDKNISFGLGISRKIGKYDAKLDYSYKDEEDNSSHSFGVNNLIDKPNFSLFAPYFRLRENVAQIVLSRKAKKHSFSFGGEAGRTSLDSYSDFYNGDGVNYVLDPNSHSQTKVAETRYEAFIADTYEISKKLNIEGKLRLEKSHIAQEGDNQKERDFTYLKPRIAASYKYNDKLDFNLSYERELGQLDFNDFAFQAQILEGNNTQSNAELRPEKADVFKAEFKKTWGKSGNLNIYALYVNIHDAVVLVPIIENSNIIGESVGNVESAWRRGYGVNTKIPLDKLSKGLEINAEYTYRQSQIKDPFTHQNRELFYQGDNSYNINVTKNFEVEKLSLNAFFLHGERNTDYRMDSQYLWPNINFWGLSGEYKGIKNYTISMQYDVPNGIRVYRHRSNYKTSRLDGELQSFHLRYRDISPRLQFTIRRNI